MFNISVSHAMHPNTCMCEQAANKVTMCVSFLNPFWNWMRGASLVKAIIMHFRSNMVATFLFIVYNRLTISDLCSHITCLILF